MTRISKTKSKSTRPKGAVNVSMDCRECGRRVDNVDSQTSSVLCYRCTAKSLNPHTRFLDEISPEELKNLMSKR